MSIENAGGRPTAAEQTPLPQLSDAARSVWAKSPDAEGRWLPLWQHLDDAATVAGALFDLWLPTAAQRILADPFGGDIEAARCAAMFLAGTHDIGKATPAFAVQDSMLAARMCAQGLAVPATPAELLDRSRVPHALAGHHLLCRWLLARGWSPRRVPAWAVVVGGHHGVPPDSITVANGSPTAYAYLYGTGSWVAVQDELLERMAVRTGAGVHLDQWREIPLPQRFQVLMSALVVLADWIASNQELFGFHVDPLPAVSEDPARAAAALTLLDLPTPWDPGPAVGDVTALFESRFALPVNATPRPVQRDACGVAEQMGGPGLMIIEAPMGEGKTEAALAAAETLCRRFGGGGVILALPTQATTDAMFSRVVDWLDTFGSIDEPVGAVTLSHGKARANRIFQGLVRAGIPTQIDLDDRNRAGECGHSVVAHSWMSGRHKTPLANFVVATIDQLLFAALRSRYLMLRHLGLAGKVVIIDEVHAYDAFMNSYLTRVLTWLGAYGVPVVALSATLPSERRRALIDAYRGGPTEAAVTDAPGEPENALPQYPLITWTGGGEIHSHAVAASSRRTVVSISCLAGNAGDDLDALIPLLRQELADGGCAVVVRNTVSRAMRTGEALMRAFPGEVTVAHSRFIAADRLRRDGELLDRFGSPSRAGGNRPRRHIVVATQVIEQSLDVDFDLLITDLAPIDLVLQRMGRLHRHVRGEGQCDRPPKLRQARMLLTGVDFRCDPPALETGAADWVYHRHPLLRAAAVLKPRIGSTITLPDDIAPLVELAYGTAPCGPDEWQGEMQRQRTRWEADIESRAAEAAKFQVAEPAATGQAILGWVSGGVGDADDEAEGRGQVRDGKPSLEVILLQQDQDGGWHTPSWLPDGQGSIPVPVGHTPSAAVAAAMLGCTVRLPVALSVPPIENILRDETPQPWGNSKLIHRLPVLLVDQSGHGSVGDHHIHYTPALGLQSFKGDPR